MAIVFITQKIVDDKNIQSFANDFYENLKGYNKNVFIMANQNKINNKNKNFFFLKNLISRDFFYINKFYKILQFYFFIINIYFRFKIRIIFVHQMDIFVFLSLPLKILGIKIYYWRAHTSHKFKETISYYIADKLISTNKNTIKIIRSIKEKYILTGHLIPKQQKYDEYNLNNDNSKINILIFGRITKVKNINKILFFLNNFLVKYDKNIVVDIYGPHDYTKNDVSYYNELLKIKETINKKIKLNFLGTIKKENLLINKIKYDFSINFSAGALDKTIIELLNFNIPTFSNNKSYREEIEFNDLNKLFIDTNEGELAKNIMTYLSLPDQTKIKYIKKMKYFINMNNNIENTLNLIFNTGHQK